MVSNLKYLKTVILENFQSHKYTSIDFDESLNIILGPSDSGKTAIIRGIKWALYNEPSGDFFIREGESEASVTLIFSDNTKVQRTRSKSKNLYILYNNKGEQIKFEGFGLNVPEEIIEEIGIRKIKLDSDSTNAINIAEQLDGPFLLSEKTSTRAGAIGRLIGVNIIDEALRETLKDIRNLSANKKNTEDRVSKLDNELKEYDYLDELVIKLGMVEELYKLIQEKTRRLDRLNLYVKQYRETTNESKIVNEQLLKLKSTDEINSILEQNQKNIYDLKYYSIKRMHLIDNQKEMKTSKDVLNKLKDIDDIGDIFDKSKQIITNIRRYENIKINMDRNIKDIDKGTIITSKLNKLPDAERALASLDSKSSAVSRLIKLNNNFRSNQNNIKLGNDFIKRFDGLGKIESFYKDTIRKEEKLSELKRLNKQIKSVKDNGEATRKELNKFNRDIDNYLDKYKELLIELEVCPLCLSNIDSNKIDHIMSHYN